MRNLRVKRTNPNPNFAIESEVPGQALGVKNMKEVQEFNSKQLIRQGTNYSYVVGSQDINIKLQGQGKFFVGLLLLDSLGLAALNNQLVFSIDTSTLIQKTTWTALSNFPTVSNYTGMYYPINSLLSPQSTITLTYIATAGPGVLYITSYYI